MRACILLLLSGLVISASACRAGEQAGSTGVPNPPFQGDPPLDPYVYAGEPGVYGGSLVMAKAADMRTFNPLTVTDAPSAEVLFCHVFRSLVDYRYVGDSAGFDYGLCKQWEVSPDGLQWTFYLRRGVRWSDGEPFDADDVLFTYRVAIDENAGSSVRESLSEGRDSEGGWIFPRIEKLDDHTVRFTLSKLNGSFLDAVYAMWLVPEHKWSEAWHEGRFGEGMKVGDGPSDVVSLGPYHITEVVTGERIVLERNPYFWKVDRKGQRLPYLDRIVFVIAKDFNTIQLKLLAGEIDVMPRVRAEDYAAIKGAEGPGLKVEDIGVSLDAIWLALNQNTGADPRSGKPLVAPWKLRLYRDQRFRQAIAHAIDREGLILSVFAGRAVPIYSFVTPGDSYWYSDDRAREYSYDPERARRLFLEAGLRDADGDGFLEESTGRTAEVNILTNSESAQRIGAANFIAQNLRRVGLKSGVDARPLSVVLNSMQAKYDFDALLLSWQTAVPPGPTNSKSILLSSGRQHVCFPMQSAPSTEWEAQIDDLVHRIETSGDSAERRRLYGELQQVWSEQLPEIDLVAQREAVAYRDKFGNLRPSPLPPRVTWNCEEIYIKPSTANTDIHR